MGERIERVINNFKKQYRGDLYNEVYIFMHDHPGATDRDLHNFCRRYLYRYALKGPSLDAPANDQDGEMTTFGDLVPSRTDLNEQLEASDKVERLTEKLKENEKLLFELYYARDIPVKEISELYGPLTGIKSEKQIYRILRKFKQNEPNTLPVDAQAADPPNATRPKKAGPAQSKVVDK